MSSAAGCVVFFPVQPELEFDRMIVNSEGHEVREAFICDELYAIYRVANVGTGEARVQTQVEGVPALRLEMIDTTDPVMQGEVTSYRIRVKNQGTAVDTDISVSLELPSELELVDSEGPTPVAPLFGLRGIFAIDP